jgi:hypothetical protein
MAPRCRLPVAATLAVAWIILSYRIHVWPHASFELRYLSQFIVATIAALAAAVYIWRTESTRRA